MYSDYGDYLLDKFRYSRENLTMSSHSSISMPVSLLTGTEVGT